MANKKLAPIDKGTTIHLLTINRKDIQHWENELDHAKTPEARGNAEINLYRHILRQYILVESMECSSCLQK